MEAVVAVGVIMLRAVVAPEVEVMVVAVGVVVIAVVKAVVVVVVIAVVSTVTSITNTLWALYGGHTTFPPSAAIQAAYLSTPLP